MPTIRLTDEQVDLLTVLLQQELDFLESENDREDLQEAYRDIILRCDLWEMRPGEPT